LLSLLYIPFYLSDVKEAKHSMEIHLTKNEYKGKSSNIENPSSNAYYAG
jgi:hypothetical protein